MSLPSPGWRDCDRLRSVPSGWEPGRGRLSPWMLSAQPLTLTPWGCASGTDPSALSPQSSGGACGFRVVSVSAGPRSSVFLVLKQHLTHKSEAWVTACRMGGPSGGEAALPASRPEPRLPMAITCTVGGSGLGSGAVLGSQKPKALLQQARPPRPWHACPLSKPELI